MKKSSTPSKRRFWLKIPANFFDLEHMLLLERHQNSERLQIIWLRLLTFCLKKSPLESEAGILRLSEKIPYDEKLLASVLRVDLDSFRVAFHVFIESEMIVIQDDETIYIEAVQTLIGSETDAAPRMRLFRKRQQATHKKDVTTLPRSSKKLRLAEERSDSGPPPAGGGGPESLEEEVEIKAVLETLEAQTRELKKRRA